VIAATCLLGQFSLGCCVPCDNVPLRSYLRFKARRWTKLLKKALVILIGKKDFVPVVLAVSVVNPNIYLLHHVNPFTIRTYPGRPIRNTPFILIKTSRANFKATGTAPTEWLLSFTAMTDKFFFPFPSP
jgi:hypothetical protein